MDFIEITLQEDAFSEEQFRMRFFSTVDSEEHSFVFLRSEKRVAGQREENRTATYLLPVGSSPFWQFSEVSSQGEISFILEGIPLEAVLNVQAIVAVDGGVEESVEEQR